MRYIIILILLITILMPKDVSAQVNLTTSQEHIKNIAKTVGESICSGKMCFGKTLQAIAWQESSFGVQEAQDGIALGAFQVKISTAKWIIKTLKLKQYYYIIGDEWLIASKLLNDPWFSAAIAAHYLKMNYEIGMSRDHWDPWILTVSRYNGGNFNRKYLNKIVTKIRKLS